MFTGSGPSLTARLMLEHKGIDHTTVHMIVGPHAFGLLGRGFRDDDRAGAEDRRPARAGIARDLASPRRARAEPPLFPADPGCAAGGRGRRALGRGAAGRRAAARPVRGAARAARVLTASIATPARSCARRSACRARSSSGWRPPAHRATDEAGEEDGAPARRAAGPDRRVDRDGVLDGPELNAADFQIAPSIALLLRLRGSRADRRAPPGGGAGAAGRRPTSRGRCRVLPAGVAGVAARRRRRRAGAGQTAARDVLQATAHDGASPGCRCARTPARRPRGAMAADDALPRRRARARRRSDPRDRLRRESAERASSAAGWSSCRCSRPRAPRPGRPGEGGCRGGGEEQAC